MITIPHLETNVTVACQLSCVACNHFVALQRHEARQRLLDLGQLEGDLYYLSKVLHAEAWGALGGEPLLHPQLIEILDIVHRSGICDKIEVWTNGLALKRQTDFFWASPNLHRIVLSIYPSTVSQLDVEWIRQKCVAEGKELQIKDESVVPNFEQLLESVPTNARTTQIKFNNCFFKAYSRVIDNGFFYRCCTSPFIPRLLLGLPEGTDGLAVDATLTEQKVVDFLFSPKPAASCTRCAGLAPGERRRVAWHEQRDPEAWKHASAGGV